uniref:MCF.2 cell line derived transforming sequence like n=1 Tax=Varanus komodoensis TaxID=61221 RepID=A0A8D2L5G8_VARKO
MHQDIVPLCAEDIEDQLRKKFAYLSGGRGKDGCPVITFPEYSTFSEIPDHEFQNVLTYLANIPSCSLIQKSLQLTSLQIAGEQNMASRYCFSLSKQINLRIFLYQDGSDVYLNRTSHTACFWAIKY